MRNKFLLPAGLMLAFFMSLAAAQADYATQGLWVGEVVLNKVNETVSGFDANNNVVAPDPSVTTPVQSPAHLRILLHVDTNGVVRLLKSVAVLDKSTNGVPNLSLITDESLYPNFPGNGRRFTAAAFDFGDGNISSLLNNLAVAAGAAAATNGDATAAAQNVVNIALSNPPSMASAGYQAFLTTSLFQSAPGLAGAAATATANQAMTAGALPQLVQNLAQAAALKALSDGGVFVAADQVENNEQPMTGTLTAGGTLTGSIYLGASHPTNPFMERRHPDHTIGYAITRALTISFYTADNTNAVQTASFGVDQINGTYHEEINGLHKPLGPNQNIGLITDGYIKLSRVSQTGVLNQ